MRQPADWPGLRDDGEQLLRRGSSALTMAGSVPEEGSYTCDSCGEEIVIPIDWSAGSVQSYVEDCPVCCNPNVIEVELDADGDVRVSGRAEQDRY